MGPSAAMPPIPTDDSERKRWEETHRRRAMLYGAWRQYAIDRMTSRIGHVRREAWGEPDLSSCVFQASVGALAVLYDRQPVVTHDDPSAAPLIKMVADAGFWSLMQRVQRDTLGLREMLVHIDCRLDDIGVPQIIYRPVYPDLVIARPDSAQPDRPVEIREARERQHPVTGRRHWAWDVWDVSGPSAEYVILDADASNSGKPISEEYGVTEYPYGDRKILPYVMYHAQRTGFLWDPYTLIEVVEGTLNSCVDWTNLGHNLTQAAWAQRWTVGARLPSSIEGQERREAIVTDPATVLMFEAIDDAQPMIGQWANPTDLASLFETVAGRERRVAAFAGISPADVQRVAGDPRSGFAIALNREAQREAQRRFEPVFRPSDEQMMATTAAIVNAVAGTSYPESGYRVAYVGLPPSPEERQGEREHILQLLDRGLIDRIDAHMALNPGANEDDAKLALLRKARRDADLAAQLSVIRGTDAQATTLPNGAQAAVAQALVTAVAAGQLPRDSAIALLGNLLGFSPQIAEEMVGSAGRGFRPATA